MGPPAAAGPSAQSHWRLANRLPDICTYSALVSSRPPAVPLMARPGLCYQSRLGVRVASRRGTWRCFICLLSADCGIVARVVDECCVGVSVATLCMVVYCVLVFGKRAVQQRFGRLHRSVSRSLLFSRQYIIREKRAICPPHVLYSRSRPAWRSQNEI